MFQQNFCKPRCWPKAFAFPFLLILVAHSWTVVEDKKPAVIGRSSASSDEPASQQGQPLSKAAILELAALFNENPLTGGQVPPRAHKWVNENVSIFLQFDRSNAAEATALRYIGIAVKGVFCAEAQPDKAFTHFHRYDAPKYPEGHGRNPGDQGYWLLWVSVDEFELRGRKIKPGVDYEAFPTPPPVCGPNVPEVSFTPPGAAGLTKQEITRLVKSFGDKPFTGGQVAPRVHKWVNKNISIFLQFDRANPLEATELRYIGIAVNGVFCKSKQPHTDFPHLHRFAAPIYREGHGRNPGEYGSWLLWVAVDEFEVGGRRIRPGVDREFARLKIPEC